jgi:hypothetical protein
MFIWVEEVNGEDSSTERGVLTKAAGAEGVVAGVIVEAGVGEPDTGMEVLGEAI